ncbi:rRNA maturation RNase YbeY [Putridiphycobacter roseus]|uniref:Endoribonuclease YbeY n=2 Tax=Putridiphycobacter roseus TaxID=2219161 RepID=A0A2W1N183_9FLAO|nr:rRNA maturation RNase YbeY [Putridiphycobacter roseus]
MDDVTIPDFNPEFLRLWIQHIAENNHKTVGELSYIFCSDEYILNINKEHLNHDYYTDIITFNYNEEEVLSGDIFISVDTVATNAEEYGNGVFKDELERVIIHGVLHLIGFNDKTDEDQKEMTLKEDEALELRERFT